MGIGTGPVLLSVDGDSGIGTALGDATDGDWMVQYKLGKLKLEGSGEKALQAGNTISVQINFGSLFFYTLFPSFSRWISIS